MTLPSHAAQSSNVGKGLGGRDLSFVLSLIPNLSLFPFSFRQGREGAVHKRKWDKKKNKKNQGDRKIKRENEMGKLSTRRLIPKGLSV